MRCIWRGPGWALPNRRVSEGLRAGKSGGWTQQCFSKANGEKVGEGFK